MPENVPLPVSQQGFRNLLAGMYAHTGAHIMAAPMAHYLATSPEQSRYRYSHSSETVQVYALEKFLLNEPLTMRFRYATNKQRIAFHPFMDYIFRPTEVVHLCAYQCAQTLRTVRQKTDQESFEFLSDHPFQNTDCVVYHSVPTVPCFPWNFLPHTTSFTSSLLADVDASAPDYLLKEKYARRFMILFLPFRELNDLMINGSYLQRLQMAIAHDEIAPEMLEVADNIQNIHNSLKSEMVENLLTSETSLPESAEVDADEDSEDDEDVAHLLQQIGNLLAPSSAAASITEEPQAFFRKIPKTKYSMDALGSEPVQFPELEDVFVDATGTEATNSQVAPDIPRYKYKATSSTLNRLVMKRFLHNPDEATNTEMPSEDSDVSTNWQVTATGTWESIVAWGRKAKLDTNQQTAFQILSATFVLTFVDDMEIDEVASQRLREQQTLLRRLARIDRQPETKSGPTRLFVTGPAGAGKCTFAVLSTLMALHKSHTFTSFTQPKYWKHLWPIVVSLASLLDMHSTEVVFASQPGQEVRHAKSMAKLLAVNSALCPKKTVLLLTILSCSRILD